MIGCFKNNGNKWAKKGEVDINIYDFQSLSIAKKVPTGVELKPKL